MALWWMTLGCVGVFFGGQQGEEFGDGDSASVVDSGEASDDTGSDTDTDTDDTGSGLDVLDGVFSGVMTVDADVYCVGSVSLEVSGSSLSGSAECGNKDYTISGSLGSASISRDDGSSWELDLEAPDDQTIWGQFEGEDASGVDTSGSLEGLFDGD